MNDLKKKYHDIEMDRDDQKESIKELNLRYQKLILEHETKSKDLEAKNEEYQCHKRLLAEEIVKMRAEKKKLEQEKQKYYDALLRIKSSFYETKVFSHLQSKGMGNEDKEQSGNLE